MRATMKRKSMVALAMILALTITPPVALAASKGCIVQGFNEVNDPALSMYVGGDYRFGTVFNDFAESEGMTVVNGSVTGSPNAGPNGELNGGGKSNRLIAGRVAWGMGYIPAANGTHLAVGGDINLTNGKTVLTSGSITIGGRMVNGKAGIANSKNMPYGSNTVWAKWWAYGNHPTVYSQLGRNRALQVDLAGDGTITDFNFFAKDSPSSKRSVGGR